jgi:endonuclease I
MKQNLKKIFAVLLAVYIAVLGIPALPVSAIQQTAMDFSPYATATQPTEYSSKYNSGTRGVVCTTLDGTGASGYYTGNYTYENLSVQSSTALKSSLNKLMTDTHSYRSSYEECHTLADRTDCENENKKVTLIYTSYQATMDQWNGWNREHVWPQSLGGNNDSDGGGGADLHHVRPSDSGVNSSRGNKLYGYAGSDASPKYGSDPAVGVLGGTYNSTYFEPIDNVKGDVARIILYVHVRWDSAWGADDVTKVFQSVDVLLEWCAQDPVDTWEMGRNEVVQAIQGNRNVFIDYPEYAWQLYGKTAPDDMVTPSRGAIDSEGGSEGGSGDNEGGASGETPDVPDIPTQDTKTKISTNIYYGDTLKFMFASNEKPTVSTLDDNGNTVNIDIKPFI